MTSALLPIYYYPPPVSPSGVGLYTAVNWVQDGTEPTRFLASGVQFSPHNVLLDDQFGVWGEDWCVDPDDITDFKTGDRFDEFPEFDPITIYGFDMNQCGDLTDLSRMETLERASHTLELLEQRASEIYLAGRLVSDSPTPHDVDSLIEAVSYLEGEIAKQGVVGYLHAGAQWAAYAAADRLDVRSGRTPLGNFWVFGGGYVDYLGDTIVATTQPTGWRGPAVTRDTIKHEYNQYIAIAERSLLIGYEAVIASVEISTGS